MANVYDTKEAVLNYLKDSPMDRGFYKNSKWVVRYLYNIFPQGRELFVGYVSKRSAINTLMHKSKSMSVTGVNVRDNGVFDWFVNAEFLGNTPEEAGLLEVK